MSQDPFGLAAARIEQVQVVQYAPTALDMVVLDRVEDLAQDDTPYCVHGRVTCVWCRAWCWLGDSSHREVSAGRLAPLCRPCADRTVRPAGVSRVSNVGDHRRADGPH